MIRKKFVYLLIILYNNVAIHPKKFFPAFKNILKNFLKNKFGKISLNLKNGFHGDTWAYFSKKNISEKLTKYQDKPIKSYGMKLKAGN